MDAFSLPSYYGGGEEGGGAVGQGGLGLGFPERGYMGVSLVASECRGSSLFRPVG
jgi:hypothetical protein